MNNKKIHLNIKQPYEKHIFRQHFRSMGNRRRKAKISFDSEDDAWEFIKSHCIHGYIPYRCDFCSLWHIGSANSKCLDDGKIKR